MISYSTHDKKDKDFRYVYRVMSRRIGGISLGINLGNYCNWKCIYCEVNEKSKSPIKCHIDLNLFEAELDNAITNILSDNTSREPYTLKSITFSGEGEPTISPDFLDSVKVVKKIREKYSDALKNVKTVVITNGSNFKSEKVQQSLDILNLIRGEIWFKIDRVNQIQQQLINGVETNSSYIVDSIKSASRHCKIIIQSCWFKFSKSENFETEREDFIGFIKNLKNDIDGVLIYTIARECHSEEAKNITPLSSGELSIFEEKIKSMGIPCKSFS